MAGRNRNRALINEINAGNEAILLYIFKRNYGELKAIFRSYGISEKEIPAQAAAVIVKIWMEIKRNNFSENIDLTTYLLNTTKEHAEQIAAEKKAERKNKVKSAGEMSPTDIIAECVMVLDTESRHALQWRYAENQSIEQVAEKLKVDVAAAHDFLNKAFTQLSSIVKIRMEYTS